MPTLPTPGGDNNTWGTELNEWLAKGGQTHDIAAGYGAVADDSTDAVAAVTNAISDITAAGAGVLWIPKGTFRLTATTAQSGLTWHLSVPSDNIRIAGPGTLKTTTADAHIFNVGGWLKSGSNWTTQAYVDWGAGQPTYYTINTAAEGATSVTTTTAANAGNFAAGDKVFIRTGQLLAARITEPDAEINEVVSADAGTGIIVLKYPLSKGYAQEYFISGTTGLTSTAVTANLATFGIAKVTARTSSNVTIDGIGLEATGAGSLITGANIDGLTIKNIRAVGRPLMNMGNYRGGLIRHNYNSCNTTNVYGITGATGTSDVLVEDNTLVNSQAVYQIHLHEGTARITVRNNRILSKPTGSAYDVVSVRARAYNITIDNNELVNGGPIGIFVDETCTGGGTIVGNVFSGTGFNDAVGVTAANWIVHGNKTGALPATTYYPAPHRTRTETLSGWVKHNAQTITLGVLPLYSIVTRVVVFVADFNFNSSGTDQVTVGYDGGTDFYATAVNVDTTFTRTDATLNGYGPVNFTAARTAKAYYVNGGTEPTQGEAFVLLEYVTAARR